VSLHDSIRIWKSRKKEGKGKIGRYIDAQRTHSCIVYIDPRDVCDAQIRRYVVIYALRRNLTFILPFRPSNYLFLSRSYTKLPFDVKQPTRRLLLCPLSLLSLSSLYYTHDYCICAIAVVGRFEFSPAPWRKKEWKKKKHTPIDSSSRLKRCSYEKRTVTKKCPRACVFSGVQLIEVHLYAHPATRRSGNLVRNSGQRWCPRCALPSLFRELLASTNFGWREREAMSWRALGRTDIN